jgi:HTH-type transcriptional regulator, competence development regulator
LSEISAGTSGLRIDDAAALCGVSVDLLSRLENGRSGVSSERLLKVLDGLGLVMAILNKTQVAGGDVPPDADRP